MWVCVTRSHDTVVVVQEKHLLFIFIFSNLSVGRPFFVCLLWDNTRSDDLNLSEVFETLSKKEHQRLWERVLAVVSPIVEERRFLPQDEHQVSIRNIYIEIYCGW